VFGHIIEDGLKAWIYRESSLEHGSRLIVSAQRGIDHSRMEVEPRVSRVNNTVESSGPPSIIS
jgi:hypothetical protein